MRLPNSEVLRHAEHYLHLLSTPNLTLAETHELIQETVQNYADYYNRGFITYRKSVTEAGQFAALEWSGSGSTLTDALGRTYIDCLGGYGIFSAGINHPRIVQAVADQMKRMALNSQELLEPWRGALARLIAEVTPGDLDTLVRYLKNDYPRSPATPGFHPRGSTPRVPRVRSTRGFITDHPCGVRRRASVLLNPLRVIQ